MSFAGGTEEAGENGATEEAAIHGGTPKAKAK